MNNGRQFVKLRALCILIKARVTVRLSQRRGHRTTSYNARSHWLIPGHYSPLLYVLQGLGTTEFTNLIG